MIAIALAREVATKFATLRVDLGLADTVWHDQPAAGPHCDGE